MTKSKNRKRDQAEPVFAQEAAPPETVLVLQGDEPTPLPSPADPPPATPNDGGGTPAMSSSAYLTPEWINRWLEKRRLRDDLPFAPKKSALMLVDLQRYFCDPEAGAFVPASDPILPNLLDLARLFAEKGRPIVLTRHVDDPAAHPLMAKWWKSAMKASDPETKLIPHLDPFLPNAILVTKHHYDPFFKTGLAQILRGRGVEQVVIGGVLTHLCCETAARAAFAHDFAVFFLLDGTATDSAEQHDGTLRNLEHGFAVLAGCAEIREAIGRGGAV